MIQTLIFDLGNVLLFFDHKKMIVQMAKCLSMDPHRVKEIIFNDTHLHAYEKGKLSSKDLFDLLQAQTDFSCDYHNLLHSASDIFTPNLPLISLLPSFKKQNKRLVLLSNTVDMHIDFVKKKYTLLDHFDELILSYEVGMRKPEEEIYLRAIEAARCPKESALFIDDMKENIDAAEKVGLPSFHFLDTKQFLEHLSKKQLEIHAK